MLSRLIILGLMSLSVPLAAQTTIVGPAIVRGDGTLAVDGHRFALYGIDLAPLGRDCRTAIRPPRCAERAVLVLENLIEGFVHCQPITPKRAICTIAGARLFDERTDLAAELLREGYALTRPEAPAFYRRLEAVAKARQQGIWGENIIDIR